MLILGQTSLMQDNARWLRIANRGRGQLGRPFSASESGPCSFNSWLRAGPLF